VFKQKIFLKIISASQKTIFLIKINIMPVIHFSECPFCKSRDIENIFSVKDYTVSNEDYAIIHCKSCGFRFTQDIPDRESIGKYYKAESYISHTDSHKGIINKLYHFARKIMLGKKYRLIKNFTGRTTGELLDIGAGTGYFDNYMNQKGFSITGIEADEDARKVAKESFNLEFKTIDFVYRLPEKQFDIITLWHVLEHVHDLDGYMKQISKTLKDDGTAVIALPNFTSFDGKHYKNRWAGYDVPRHLWHFSPDFFSMFADHYGFDIIKTKQLPLDGIYLSFLTEKSKQNKLWFIAGSFWGFISYLAGLFATKKGSSIIYFLKKKN